MDRVKSRVEDPSYIPGRNIFKIILGINCIFNFSFIVYQSRAKGVANGASALGRPNL